MVMSFLRMESPTGNIFNRQASVCLLKPPPLSVSSDQGTLWFYFSSLAYVFCTVYLLISVLTQSVAQTFLLLTLPLLPTVGVITHTRTLSSAKHYIKLQEYRNDFTHAPQAPDVAPLS